MNLFQTVNHISQAYRRTWNSPVDVSHIENLAGTVSKVGPGDGGVIPMKLNDNRGLAQVGSHAVISNGGHHGDGGGDVVEDSVRPWFGEGHANENKGRSGHEGASCPVPVGAISRDLKGGAATDPLYIILSANPPRIEARGPSYD